MTSSGSIFGVYGSPPHGLVEIPPTARQMSPLIPGAEALETLEASSAAGMAMLAPPGTIERRYALAGMLRALPVGSPFVVLAPKDLGGSRLGDELARFGCTFEESAKRHHRICTGRRPAVLEHIDDALAEGAPRLVGDLGLWSQPGIFSWNRVDPGTALLLKVLPQLAGRGADLGCGVGVLGHGVLASEKVTRLDLFDIDRRAVEAARRNLADARATVHWVDVVQGIGVTALDFVVMNPPFHNAGAEDRSLGQVFIRRAAEALRRGGRLWLTANRHLPYEAVLKPLFTHVTLVAEADGYKVIEAAK